MTENISSSINGLKKTVVTTKTISLLPESYYRDTTMYSEPSIIGAEYSNNVGAYSNLMDDYLVKMSKMFGETTTTTTTYENANGATDGSCFDKTYQTKPDCGCQVEKENGDSTKSLADKFAELNAAKKKLEALQKGLTTDGTNTDAVSDGSGTKLNKPGVPTSTTGDNKATGDDKTTSDTSTSVKTQAELDADAAKKAQEEADAKAKALKEQADADAAKKAKEDADTAGKLNGNNSAGSNDKTNGLSERNGVKDVLTSDENTDFKVEIKKDQWISKILKSLYRVDGENYQDVYTAIAQLNGLKDPTGYLIYPGTTVSIPRTLVINGQTYQILPNKTDDDYNKEIEYNRLNIHAPKKHKHHV